MLMDRAKITGVVLAGGRGRRMGGIDKGLVEFNGRPMISYALDALRCVADTVLINANRNHETYSDLGYPVISDLTGDYDGPLAGILTAMKAAKTPYLLTMPCDCPLLRGELLIRLPEAYFNNNADCCAAHDGERLHPVFLFLGTVLTGSLEHYLDSSDRKIDRWLGKHNLVQADFSDHRHMFSNINTPEQCAELENIQVCE